jgi:hypothetical protein
MTAFLAQYWPIIALAWFAAMIFILRIFQLGADADDQTARDMADAHGDFPALPADFNPCFGDANHQPILPCDPSQQG